MKKRLYLPAILLISIAILVGGCGSPKAIKPLTDAEKEKMIEIALADPEVSKWLDTEDVYSTEVGWSAVGWNDSEATGWARLEYEEIADGKLPTDRVFPSDRVTINPDVHISVGEPAGKHLHVAIDREKMEVVNVELMPGRPSAGPEPTPGPASGVFPAEHPRDFPENLRWLTDEEKVKLVEIALNTPKAQEWLQKESQYKTGISWLALNPNPEGEGYSGYRRFDYDIVATGIPRGKVDITPEGSSERIVSEGVPEDAEIHPSVTIWFGEPTEWVVSVAVDIDSEKVVLEESYPARKGIVIPPPPEDVD